MTDQRLEEIERDHLFQVVVPHYEARLRTAELIAEIRRLREEARFVPVSERLPPDSFQVEVYWPDSDAMSPDWYRDGKWQVSSGHGERVAFWRPPPLTAGEAMTTVGKAMTDDRLGEIGEIEWIHSAEGGMAWGLVAELLAETRRLREEGRWIPVTEAPTTGMTTVLIAIGGDRPRVSTGNYFTSGWHESEALAGWNEPVTHWRHLPPLPSLPEKT